ncbi:MAG TPA: NAD-dependent epimerase [Syntrophales bacterium]|nr:NAD-dependent epimerase [Syntrophales bacterium]HOD98106.1 NAD-dependent epimerase [Syntrophales bacterium]
MDKILVTGAAGFIGFHLCRKLLATGRNVVGIDNLNPYYEVRLKEDRLRLLEEDRSFRFFRLDIADREDLADLFAREEPPVVVHLAAQAGVRYSLTNPYAYLDSNLLGFLNILEGCRHHRVSHLVYASSSSVYGGNTRLPFSVHHNVDHPVSLYAATKKANELMAHSYAALYGIPCTGLRFFTVYGPWGRPDMALFLFTRAILAGEPIDVYNEGRMERDFTYIDDIIEGVFRIMARPPDPDPSWNGGNPDPAGSFAPYRLYNIGNHQPVALLDFIAALEKNLGKKAKMRLLPMQPGDVPATCADVEDLAAAVGFSPATTIATGIARFVEWYKKYYLNKK